MRIWAQSGNEISCRWIPSITVRPEGFWDVPVLPFLIYEPGVASGVVAQTA